MYLLGPKKLNGDALRVKWGSVRIFKPFFCMYNLGFKPKLLVPFESTSLSHPTHIAPSGTALDIKKFIEFHLDQNININIESLRDKSSVGRHEVIFGFDNEEILVTHNALSRDIFGEGARLSHILYQKKPGLYTVEDLLKEDN